MQTVFNDKRPKVVLQKFCAYCGEVTEIHSVFKVDWPPFFFVRTTSSIGMSRRLTPPIVKDGKVQEFDFCTRMCYENFIERTEKAVTGWRLSNAEMDKTKRMATVPSVTQRDV
jgi:hypothetical protein